MALLFLLLLTFAVVSYRVLETSLRAEIDRVLLERADHAALAAQVVPNLSIAGVSPGLPAELSSPGVYLQLLDADGRIATRSANLGMEALPVHADRLADVLAGRSFYDLEMIAGQAVRLYHRPVFRAGRVIGAVEVGTSLRSVQDTLARLRMIYAVGIGLGVSAGLAGAYGLTRLGLRPLVRLTTLAGRIGHAGDLTARLPTSGPLDEVGRLTLTFNAMLTRLQAAFEAQRSFLAEASHELRTPLAALLGNADLLARYGEDPQRRRLALDAMRLEGQRTTRLLNDLMLAVQADAGWRIELSPVELSQVLASVAERSRLWAGGVALTVPDLPVAWVLGDADRLAQVFGNLLDNALRHTPAGGTVELAVHADSPWVTISVRDTGEGISPTALSHVFDRFYCASTNGTGRAYRSGLGLFIVRWIVEQHSGQVTVESALGRGSVFQVRLPTASDCKTTKL